MPVATQGQRDEGAAGRRRRKAQRRRRGGCWGKNKKCGGYKPEFSPWRHTGSPKIRGVINLSMELANPTAPRPGNLASAGGGRAAGSKETLTVGGQKEENKRDEGKEYALLRVICPLTSLGAGQVMKHSTTNTYDYCHRCLLALLHLSTRRGNLVLGTSNIWMPWLVRDHNWPHRSLGSAQTNCTKISLMHEK